MKRVRNDFMVLKMLAVVAAVLLVLSAALWHTLASFYQLAPWSWGAVLWYGGYTTLATLLVLGTWWIDNTPQQRLIPRLHVLAAFGLWLSTIVGQLIAQSVSTTYYLKLLEAPALFLLLTLLSMRIWQAFIPRVPLQWIAAVGWAGGLAALLLAPSHLNYTYTIVAGNVYFVSGVGYSVIIGIGFLLVLVSICCIPLGRSRFQQHPTYSVGPLVFTTPSKPEDYSLIDGIKYLINTHRRHALKRGQWIHYRNHITKHQGIISTEPKSCIDAITTLIEYALHKNQTKAITLELFEDAKHPYLHCRITYTVNTHGKTEFTTFATHFSELGGHLTVKRDGRETSLIISFPKQW